MILRKHDIEEGDTEKDGAGCIDVYNSYYAVRNNQIQGETLYPSSFPKYYSFYVHSGFKVRAVITWDSHPDNQVPPSTDPLLSDLDLAIYDPSDSYIKGSFSVYNNYELVEFTASTSGYYKAYVQDWHFGAAYEYLGFAWDMIYQW